MAVSLGMLGIMLMLDICFITNYFLVRALRRWTDSTVKRKQQQKRTESATTTQGTKADTDLLGDVAFAWLVGSVKLEPMSVKKFPGWKAIPYQLGIISTSLFVILSCLLLAPDLVAKELGISQALTLEADLCETEAFDKGIDTLQEELYNITKLPLAQQQHAILTSVHQALVNDTALYGVPPYTCPASQRRYAISGSKEDWLANPQTSGSFFPGYCQEALEQALEVAQERECYHEICDCPTLPDTAIFRMIGLAEKKFCGEVCVQVPYACPAHAQEDQDNTDSKERDHRLRNDYRYQQLESAEAQRANMTEQQEPFSFGSGAIPDSVQTTATQTADKVMHQVDIASYIYIGYSCLGLFFPSPLILFRMPYWIAIKRFLFGVQKPYFICFVLCVWWGFEFLSQVYYSPDFWLFLQNLRLGDPCFVDADYLMERQQVFNRVCQELTPLQAGFNASVLTVQDVIKEVKVFDESCDCPFPNLYSSQLFDSILMNTTSDGMTALGFDEPIEFCNIIDGTETCTTMFVPSDDTVYLGNSTICTNFTESRRLVWEADLDANIQTDQWYEIWLASGFLATLVIKFAVANFGLSLMKLADPFVVCAGEFLWMAPPTDMTTSSPKTSSKGRRGLKDEGGISTREMLEAFDEQGRALPKDLVRTWFKAKQRSLLHAGFSRTVFWGLAVHLCIINLMLSVYQEIYSTTDESFTGAQFPTLYEFYEELEERDRTVLIACLACSTAVIFLGVYFVRRLNHLASIQAELFGDTDDSESESDGDERRGRSTEARLESGENLLMEGTVIQLDTEGRCSSPVLLR